MAVVWITARKKMWPTWASRKPSRQVCKNREQQNKDSERDNSISKSSEEGEEADKGEVCCEGDRMPECIMTVKQEQAMP